MTKIGVWVPGRGDASIDPGIAVLARNAEEAGFDSLIVPDHVIMRTETGSWFPFTENGIPTWDVRTPWNDAVVALSICAAVTERIQIGTGILVLPQRPPVELAKQLATIDVASGGRVFLGVGAGWYAEEFEALGVPFGTRGARMDEWIALLRAVWTGEPKPFAGEHYRLPEGVLTFPTPVHDIPILVGGMSKAALRRAAQCEGWFSLQRTDALDTGEIRAGVSAMRRVADVDRRVVLRAVGDVEPLLDRVKDFVAEGVTEFVVDAELSDVGRARSVVEALRSALG